METIKITDLKEGFHAFGGRGDVFSNTAHIAETGLHPNTLCGTPMLSTNWVWIEEVKAIGCQECIAAYKKLGHSI